MLRIMHSRIQRPPDAKWTLKAPKGSCRPDYRVALPSGRIVVYRLDCEGLLNNVPADHVPTLIELGCVPVRRQLKRKRLD